MAKMTHKQAWEIIEKEAIFGSIPEYWAWTENGRVIVERNYQGSRRHVLTIGGIIKLEPSPELEKTEPIGFSRDPQAIIADALT